MSLQKRKNDAQLMNSIPWTELQLAYTKLEEIRRFMYGNKYTDKELERVLVIRQKRMNCEYTRRCRDKLKNIIKERDGLAKMKEDLLKEISEFKYLPNTESNQ